jgi:(S)-2-hydroxy-acid oxidase
MEPVNLWEYEPLARQRLSQMAYDYIAGGADDELTLKENREAFERIQLCPRVLVDVSDIHPSTHVLGQRVEFPVLLAPVAIQQLAHPEGELATARAAAASGTIMVLSTMSTFSMEEVAQSVRGPRWFQLYCYRDREVTQQFVERAQENDYSAICVTVDTPYLGRRERDVRNRFQYPSHLVLKNFVGYVDLAAIPSDTHGSAVAAYAAGLLSPALTWEDVDWLRSVTSLPLILKGIMTVEDARLAVEHGVEGIIVSNHGGRQLDGVPATIAMLPRIVETVKGRAEVFLDGGIRRGTDVLKALALGAQAVLIGRPYVWGLAVDGEAGVKRVLALLRGEVELAMALAGCPKISDIKRSLVFSADW